MVDLAQSVQDLGLAGIIVLIALTVVIGLARQWWVPGWLYRQEREQRSKSDTQAERNAEALEKLARAVTGEPAARKRAGAGDDPG